MSVIHPGSSINFDGTDLQRSEEEEIQREDIKQQQELHELLSAELPEDLLEDSCEGSVSSTSHHDNSGRSFNRSCDSSTGGSKQVGSISDELRHKINESGDAQEYYRNLVSPQRHNATNGYANDRFMNGYSRSFTDAERWQMLQHKQTASRGNGVGDFHFHGNYNGSNNDVYGFTERREAEGSEDFDAVTHDNSYQLNNSKLSATLPSYSPQNPHSMATPGKSVRFEAFSAPTSPFNHYGMPYKPINRYQYLNSEESQPQGGTNLSSKTDDSVGSDYVDASDRNTPESISNSSELTQLRILYEARGKKMDKMTREIEAQQQDFAREKRMLSHQLAMAQDQKIGMSGTVEECQRMLQERDRRISDEEGKCQALSIEVDSLKASKSDLVKKIGVSERTVENLQQELVMLQQSDTLERARQQHEAVVSASNERYEQQILEVTSMLDEVRRTADVKTGECDQLRSRLKAALKESEDVLFEKSETINRLSRNLEDAQNHCQTLLAGSGECSFLQRQVSGLKEEKANLETKNKNLEKALAELKDNLTMYENAFQLGVTPRPLTSDGMTDSYSELMGMKRKVNGRLTKATGTSCGQSEDIVESLRYELERALANNKEKRDQVTDLQKQVGELADEAQHWRERVDEAEHQMKTMSSKDPIRSSNPRNREQVNGLEREFEESLEHLHEAEERAMRLEETCRDLKQQLLEVVEQHDADKQEAVDRCERACMLLHEDAKRAIREELMAEHEQKIYEVSIDHDGQLQELKEAVAAVSNELSEVKQSYVHICSEKDGLEETLLQQSRSEIEELTLLYEKEKEDLKSKLEEEWQVIKKQEEKEWEKRNDQNVNTKIALAKVTWMEEQSKLREEKIREISKDKEEEFVKKLDVLREELRAENEREISRILLIEKDKWEEEKEKELQSRISDLHEELNEERKTAVSTATSLAQLNWITEQQKSAEQEYEKRISEARREWEGEHNRLVEQKVNEALQKMQNKIEVLNEERDRLVNRELSRAEREWKRKGEEALKRKDEDMKEQLKEIQEKHEREYEEFTNQHKQSLQTFLDKERVKTSVKEKQKDALDEMSKQWNAERQHILQSHQAELKSLQSMYDARCQDFRAEIKRLSSAYDAMTQRNTENDDANMMAEIQRKNKEDMERLKSRMKDEYRRWKREREDLRSRLEEATTSKPEKTSGADPSALVDFREIYIGTLGRIKEEMLEFIRESRSNSVAALQHEAEKERMRILKKLRTRPPRDHSDSILLSFLSDNHTLQHTDPRNPPALLQNQPSVTRPQPISLQNGSLKTPPVRVLFNQTNEAKPQDKRRSNATQ